MINHADFMAYWKLREAGGDIWVDAVDVGDNYKFLEAEGLCRLEKYDTRVRGQATLHSSDMYNSVQKLLQRNVKHANSAYRSVVKGQRVPNSDTQRQLSAAAERLNPVDRGDFWKTVMELDADEQAWFAGTLARPTRGGR